MAQGTELIDENKLQDLISKMEIKIMEEQKDLMEKLENEDSCKMDPGTKFTSESPIYQKKLELESEIEAVMSSDLLELPDDRNFLHNLAKDDAEETARANARTLKVYKDKVNALRDEKQLFEDMLTKALMVNEALNKYLNVTEKEEAQTALRRRYDQAGIVFKTLRNEMQYILSNYYPNKSDEGISMEDLLERLITQLLNDPNDPYINIDDDINPEHLTFLIKANLVIRHNNDFTRIRFNDPRK